MPFIQNVSFDDVRKAWHYDPNERGVLISIVDPDMEHPVPKYPFDPGLVFRFKFLDIEDDNKDAITKEQAESIWNILETAKNENRNVIVHCVAGICRSGAVAEAAIAGLGFQDTETRRIPNIRVKKFLLENVK